MTAHRAFDAGGVRADAADVVTRFHRGLAVVGQTMIKA
jgi:hypothetical protein